MSVSTRVLIVIEPPRPALGTNLRHELVELIGELGLVREPAAGGAFGRARGCRPCRLLRDLVDDLLDEPQPVRNREGPDFLHNRFERSHRLSSKHEVVYSILL